MSLNKNLPLVSICIPVYNNSSYLKTTLLSLLEQTYKNIEIIIGDNASTENIENILDEIGREKFIYYKNNKNLGYSGNCNKLIEMARGKYIAIYHSDDIYKPTIVEEEVKILESNNDIGAVFAFNKFINSDGKSIRKLRSILFKIRVNYISLEYKVKNGILYDLRGFISILCKLSSPLRCPTSMVRKDIYKELGGYNEEIKNIEDQDMWIRILERKKIFLINKRLFKYRIHSKQVSNYYTSPDRRELSCDLNYIINYLKDNKITLTKSEKKSLKTKIAKDYINLIVNSVKKKDENAVLHYARLSKAEYKFSRISRKGRWQNIDKIK